MNDIINENLKLICYFSSDFNDDGSCNNQQDATLFLQSFHSSSNYV